jgi:hypothetical protein
MQATAVGCKPTLRPAPEGDRRICNALYEFIFSEFLPTHHVDQLILAANWQDAEIDRIAETLDWARTQNIDVLLVGPVPQYDAPLPYLAAFGEQRGMPDFPERHRRIESVETEKLLSSLARDKEVRYGSVYRALCDARRCTSFAADGSVVQFDQGHLTMPGSLLVAEGLRDTGALLPFSAPVTIAGPPRN